MSWHQSYKEKLTTAEEAVKAVQSGHRIYYSGNAATPFPLIEALTNRKDELENVQLNHVLLIGQDPIARPEFQGHFRHNSLFVGPADRAAINDGRADYVPVFLHQIPRLFREEIIPLDVAIIHTSPPDEHGFCSFGVEVLATKAAADCASMVIAQVNENMPRVLGDSFIHVSQMTHIVEHSAPLPELPRREITDVEQQIARHIAPLIPDGATLQLGIGGVPDAVLKEIAGKKDLGIHTEMVSDGVMEAIEKGIISGRRKSIHTGKAILTFAFGSHRLYEYLHNNPLFESHPTEYVNDPVIVAQNDNMVGINSAIEVDLTGQICSDSIGPMIYSGFGGQVDFIRGAAKSKGGRPIIALSSTAKRGEMSRIAPFLKQGAGVVTTRADVHYVVTEYGAAHLFGRNLRERAEALIGIAHPKFRDELTAAAKERRLLT
ncbi:MAG: 4-hydroxybutyrate CoA-transferase [Candidatus Eisenbacteria bacterium]|nr:4-hydroxybutyrate CoA-transferase [Candidatus Latescibacterota bacterium]MBD3300880.1 4-hydroxybutyrate CoA-transferase [Candidatus Eisenbacteria bacterium]